MNTMLKKGDRVKFARAWEDSHHSVALGATGTVKGVWQNVVVELDGFENEKIANDNLAASRGEGANIVDWIVAVPLDFLEALS